MPPEPELADPGGPGGFAVKARIRAILASPGFEKSLATVDIPLEKLISPLLSFLYATDEPVRWRAVRAVGIVVSRMAKASPESARNIMRRLIWSLNDESGGIGWGAPEAMGEIMAESELLAREYSRILISYIDEDGNLLENEPLERGALWGIARLAKARPEPVKWAENILSKQLSSPDPEKRGLAALALGHIGALSEETISSLELLRKDGGQIRLFLDGEMKSCRIADMAAGALPHVRS